MIKTKVAFLESRLFSSQSELYEICLNCSDWLDKSRPSKKATSVWSCKQAISEFQCHSKLLLRFESYCSLFYIYLICDAKTDTCILQNNYQTIATGSCEGTLVVLLELTDPFRGMEARRNSMAMRPFGHSIWTLARKMTLFLFSKKVNQGRQQKNFQGGGNGKTKTEKCSAISLPLLYQC